MATQRELAGDRLPLWLFPEPSTHEGETHMPDMVDASTLSDPQRVRRGELSAALLEAQRVGDEEAVAQIKKDIEAEYADEPKVEAEPKAPASKGAAK